jgi:hypothetical protein
MPDSAASSIRLKPSLISFSQRSQLHPPKVRVLRAQQPDGHEPREHRASEPDGEAAAVHVRGDRANHTAGCRGCRSQSRAHPRRAGRSAAGDNTLGMADYTATVASASLSSSPGINAAR